MNQKNVFNQFLKPPKIPIKNNSKDSETKLADIIKKGPMVDVDIGIVGVPFDAGVNVSGGRIGAREAPDAIRRQLSSYGTTFDIDSKTDLSRLSIADFGNIAVVNDDAEETYRRTQVVVATMLTANVLPIVLGGGHDITYPAVSAFAYHHKNVGGINIDVHYDVREATSEAVSSGMPFRKLLDDLKDNPLQSKNFVEFGADGNVNSEKYYHYLTNKNVSIYALKRIRNDAKQMGGIEAVLSQALTTAEHNTKAVFASLDIDSVSAAYAPGCSCINPNGFTADEITRLATTLGLKPQVKYFDIVETNPEYDIDNRTTRLCAKLIGCFLTGYQQRCQQP